MESWVVRLLLLCAVFSNIVCEKSGIQLVKNLIVTSNKYFRDNHLAELELPDTGLLFGTIKLGEGRLGQFDNVELQPDPEIVSHTDDLNGTVYTYKLRTGLRNLTVNYRYHINIPFVGKYGNVAITVGKKSFQLEGSVFIKQDGSCIALLQDAKVVQFGDFKVKFEPDNTPFITRIYQAVLNILHQQMIPIINRTVRSEISRPYFKETFNKFACAEISLNSTAVTPIIDHS